MKLAKIVLRDGSNIVFHREENTVLICHEDYCVPLPKASGRLTMELFALFEPLGEMEDDPNE